MLLHILCAICAVGVPCIAAICLVLGVRGNGPEVLITEAVVLLVAVVPIANQVVCTSTLALGGRTLAEHRAIVTRLSSIEELVSQAWIERHRPLLPGLDRTPPQHCSAAARLGSNANAALVRHYLASADAVACLLTRCLLPVSVP